MPRAHRRILPATMPSSSALLRSLVEQYKGKQITNTDFEAAVEAVLPKSLWFENRKSLDWFFDGWVNGTAFPQFELSDVKFVRTAKGLTASGVIHQGSAPFDLVTSVPVYGVGGRTPDLSRPRLCRRRRHSLQATCPRQR